MPSYRYRAEKSGRLAARAGMALGLALALFGVGIDWILPESSPGLGLPQLLIVAAGLALSLTAWLWRRQSFQFGRGTRGKVLAKAIGIALLTLLAVEIALTISGMPTYFPVEIPPRDISLLPLASCDDSGCRFDYERATRACAAGEMSGRECVFNRQGFADSGDFVVGADFPQRQRILVMGDSFTHGYTADIGRSYVELTEKALPQAVIWNTGISGYGTFDALQAWRQFAPDLQPQLSVLGFYVNDFMENMSSGRYQRLRDSAGRIYHVKPYTRDRWGNAVDLPAEVIFSYRARGYTPPGSEVERLIGNTRLGSLALRLLDMATGASLDASFEQSRSLTRSYLMALRDEAQAINSSLLILLLEGVPGLDDDGEYYRAALEIFRELRLPYIELRQFVQWPQDHKPAPDGHWNNAGHAKVGAILTDCVRGYFASGGFDDCPGIAMP